VAIRTEAALGTCNDPEAATAATRCISEMPGSRRGESLAESRYGGACFALKLFERFRCCCSGLYALMSGRKIIHVDMDAFYASVEQRDDASLRGRPVVVAWRGERSVVCAASYEARRFGIRSAMPALRAERLCPDALFVPPDFTRYKAVSQQIREIFLRHTSLVEPLSLDEAYLDVTELRSGLPSATAVAEVIRAQIVDETKLTASAGVSSNKFLAKIASDWHKPNGLFVLPPSKVHDFLAPLAVERIPGVGKVMSARLNALGVRTVADLRLCTQQELELQFGSIGTSLFRRARGEDDRPVEPHQTVQSISSEDTFPADLLLSELGEPIRRLSEKTWAAAKATDRIGRTVVLKLKTSNFRVLTRNLTPAVPPSSFETLMRLALELRFRDPLPPETRYRLVGVGLAGFRDPSCGSAQAQMFAEEPD
jgi:DNA polymerase IV